MGLVNGVSGAVSIFLDSQVLQISPSSSSPTLGFSIILNWSRLSLVPAWLFELWLDGEPLCCAVSEGRRTQSKTQKRRIIPPHTGAPPLFVSLMTVQFYTVALV